MGEGNSGSVAEPWLTQILTAIEPRCLHSAIPGRLSVRIWDRRLIVLGCPENCWPGADPALGFPPWPTRVQRATSDYTSRWKV